MGKKLSIITVCYNAAGVLPVTIESVLAQDTDDLEYIIQDGRSTDRTPELVEAYKERFALRNIRFVYNREADSGIYDAMNRAAACAEGDYINFMNAGDCFCDPHVLSTITGAADDPDRPAVIYGDCAVYEYGRFYRFGKCLEDIEERMPFSHQSVFAARDLVKEHPFNTDYRFSADYDFLLTAHDLGVKFKDSGITVCITTADGLSSVKYHDTLMETAMIQKAHGVQKRTEEELVKAEKVLRLKQFVLNHFPVSVKKRIRAIQIRSRGQEMDITAPNWFKT